MANNLAPAHPDLGPTVDTTDATETTLATFETEVDTTYFVDAKIVAKETDDADESATYWKQACVQNDGGTVALVGSVRDVVTDNEDTGGWDATIDVDSDDIRVRVTGAGSTNVTWRAIVNIDKI